MSGIVGIINAVGKPVERQLLQRMTDFLGDRGPDSQSVWFNKHVGLGHTLLRTTAESASEHQPYSLDGEVWITADARIDARQDLIARLEKKDCSNLKEAPDVELILRAYHQWGEDCLNYLIGDFAFAIWDGRSKELFCARDHLGVKPFYYAEVNGGLIFSNSLKCLREYPFVSDRLNKQAIGDFLIFGFYQEPSLTCFEDIRRLQPAHYLKVSDGFLRLKQYWELPVDGHIHYRQSSEYIDNFNELLGKAVGDRLRTSRVGISMSGGLDSSAVAATACKLAKEQAPLELRAFTVVYDSLIPDEERYYSGLVAKELNLPIQYLVLDNYKLFERHDQPELQAPEPFEEPLGAIYLDHVRQVATHSRVVLTGQGGDPLFYPTRRYFIDLLKSFRFKRAFSGIWTHVRLYKTLAGLGFRGELKRLLGLQKASEKKPFPNWIDKTIREQLNLDDRWNEANKDLAPLHPFRPEAYKNLSNPCWSYMFQQYDADWFPIPVEVRHPFFDLRLVEYLLAIPPVPWCLNKTLLRLAMRGMLPAQILRRPKALVAGDPVRARLLKSDSPSLESLIDSLALSRFISPEALCNAIKTENYNNSWGASLRPLYLALWLERRNLSLENCGGG